MPVAIITGASRGLGRGLARALAERNWSLVLDARGADDLEAVVAELGGRPPPWWASPATWPTRRTATSWCAGRSSSATSRCS